MADVKAAMMAKIKCKASKIRESRTNSSKKRSPEDIVFEFLKEMEDIYAAAGDPIEFDIMLDRASKWMDYKMRSYDNRVSLDIIFNDTDNWKELRAQGVHIRWSEGFAKGNPEHPTEQYFDLTHMFMKEINEASNEDVQQAP